MRITIKVAISSCLLLQLFRTAIAYEFQLSGILDYFSSTTADNDKDAYQRSYVQPRRDIRSEMGADAYQQLVSYALGGDQNDNDEYGVDVSFPTQYHPSKTSKFTMDRKTDRSVSLKQIRTEQLQIYSKYITGCKDFYEEYYDSSLFLLLPQNNDHHSSCDASERHRLNRNLNQPPLMQNYTKLGFQKLKVPARVQKQLLEHHDSSSTTTKEEMWSHGDTHVNYWKSKTYSISLNEKLKQLVWKSVKTAIQDWIHPYSQTSNTTSSIQLSPASLYGMRIHKHGSIVAPHLDRMPHVLSAILNVAQFVDEPWPIEIMGHDGIAYNLTLNPGEMLLYEGHSTIHGRPYPLKGDYEANIFVHFEPSGHSMRHAEQMQFAKEQQNKQGVESSVSSTINTAQALYEMAKQTKAPPRPPPNSDTKVPFYITPGSFEAQRWKQEKKYKVFDTAKMSEIKTYQQKITGTHTAASLGNLEMLKTFYQKDPASIHARDVNGWQPLHEAVRSGHVHVVKYLIQKGANVNVRTNKGSGGSPLWWSEKTHGSRHPMTKLLVKHGAKSHAPSF